MLIVCLSLGFALSELLLTLIKHSNAGTAKTRADRGSMIFLWVAITAGFAFGFFLANHLKHSLSAIGFLLIISGIFIRWIAILQLGKSFTVDVAITEAAKLKTDGLYRFVRHPSYLGILLILTGFALEMNSLYSFLVLVIPVFIAVNYRIKVEERVLISEFGDSYQTYRLRVKKLIPYLF